MKKWEHKIVTLSREGVLTNPNKSPEEMLNDFGDEGWEVAGCSVTQWILIYVKYQYPEIRHLKFNDIEIPISNKARMHALNQF